MLTACERIREARALRERALTEAFGPPGHVTSITLDDDLAEEVARASHFYTVETGVKGAHRIVTREYATLAEANAAAARWRSSNSTGEYVAHVFGPDGERLAS